jgi:hypothetical protein
LKKIELEVSCFLSLTCTKAKVRNNTKTKKGRTIRKMRGIAIAHNNEEPRNNNKSNRYFGNDNNA